MWDEQAVMPVMDASPRYLGYVSTEGGPLMIADLRVAAKWSGGGGGASDYERACRALEAGPAVPGAQIDVDGATAVIWDMPPGTADVWRRALDVLVVTRSFLEREDRRASLLAGQQTENPIPLGDFHVSIGWAVIIWAADSGEEIDDLDAADGHALDLSVGHSGIVVALPPGDYRCYHDDVADGSETARRCLIVPSGRWLTELVQASAPPTQIRPTLIPEIGFVAAPRKMARTSKTTDTVEQPENIVELQPGIQDEEPVDQLDEAAQVSEPDAEPEGEHAEPQFRSRAAAATSSS